MVHLSSLQDAWDDLRRHLEWSRGHPSLVFAAASSLTELATLSQRISVFAARGGDEFREVGGSGAEIAGWLTEHLPIAGITVVPLSWEEAHDRYRVLARVNELRARLARPGQGALIILGPMSLNQEAPYQAADAWAVRSLNVSIGSIGIAGIPPSPVGANEPGETVAGRLIFSGLQVPAAERTAATTAVLDHLARAARLSPTSLSAAKTAATQAVSEAQAGSFDLGLAWLASAELAGLDSDGPCLTEHLTAAITAARGLSPPSRVVLLDAVIAVGLRFGENSAATQASADQLALRRDLAERLATPEALRDLSVSLNNVGAVARARGDWDRAATVYDESLTIARDLAARLATPEALRDLSVSLDNVGAVARARGDWDRGKASRDAALAIAEGVAVRDNSHETIRLLDWLRRESSTPPSERTNRDPDSEP